MSAFSATPPTAADLARCAGIAAPEARLACYDTLAGRAAPAAAAAPTSASPAPPATATSATATAPTLPPTPAPASTFASDPRNFGFSEAQQQAQPHAAAQGLAAIQARIIKIVGNRGGRSYLVLDNGQTWALVDGDADDARLSPGDPVTIKRASLGSFMMLTQSRQSYHVRRTQ